MASNPEVEQCAYCGLPRYAHDQPFTQLPAPSGSGWLALKQVCSFFVPNHKCSVCGRFTGGCCTVKAA